MRIEQLDLIAYGPFTGTQLNFGSANEGGLHLVYGPNEAGKSSALTAVLDFLFGFPNRSASTFQTSSQKVRVGATVSAGTQRHSLVRRKGRKDTLLSASSGETFDAAVLDDFLQGMDRKRFESEFGISYTQLVSGGRELANGKGDLASALFAVATGSQRWLTTRRTLEDEARKLFLSRGTVPKINALIETLDSQKRQLGQLQLLPHDWDRRQSELADVESRWKQSEQELIQLQERVKRIEYNSKLKPLLQDYRLCRQRFLNANVQWLPNDEDFDQWEQWLDRVEQDLARVNDRKDRVQRLEQQLELPLDVATLDAGDTLERLVEGRSRFAELTQTLDDLMRSNLQLKESWQQQHQQWLEALQQPLWENLKVAEAPAQPSKPKADEIMSSKSVVQQTMFWDDAESELDVENAEDGGPCRETNWYETKLTASDDNALDVLSDELTEAETGYATAKQTLATLQARQAELKSADPVTAEPRLSSDQAEHVEQFLSSNSTLLGTLGLQEDWLQRLEHLAAEATAVAKESTILETTDLQTVWSTDWKALSDTNAWHDRWQKIEDQRREKSKADQLIASRLNELHQRSGEDSLVSDQAYQLWLQFLNRSTDLVTKELVESEKVDFSDVEDLVSDLHSEFPEASTTAPESPGTKKWLAAVHRWLIGKVLELNQSRVDRSDELAAIRQREQELSLLKDNLAEVRSEVSKLEKAATELEQEWLQHIEPLPIRCSISDLPQVKVAVDRLMEFGRQYGELQKRLAASQRDNEPVLKHLQELIDELEVEGRPSEPDETAKAMNVDREKTERHWHLLKNLLSDWRKGSGENQKRQVQVESLRQRIEEAQAAVKVAEKQLKSKTHLWQETLRSANLPDQLTETQYQQWRNVQSAMDEVQDERNRVLVRLQTVQADLAEYLSDFETVNTKFGGSSGYRKLLASLTADWQRDRFLVWQQNWKTAQSEVVASVGKWKTVRLEAQKSSVQRQQWQLQQKELETELHKLLATIADNFESLLGQLQQVGPVFRLKQEFSVRDLPLEQLQLLAPELKVKVAAVENLMADASILDSRLEGIQKLEGVRLLDQRNLESLEDQPSSSMDTAENVSFNESQHRQLQLEVEQQKKITQQLSDQLAVKRREIEQLQKRTEAVEMQQMIEMNLAELSDLCDQYLEYSLSAVLLDETMTRHSQQNQHPILAKASDHFARLTLGSFRGLKTEMDSNGRKLILGERRDMSTVEVDGMSEGTETQLYLALRISALEHFLSGGTQLPFVVDDVLKDYDDQRALAALKLFAEVGQKTQVILFTHHQHLLDLVQNNLPATEFQVHHLQSGHAQTTG